MISSELLVLKGQIFKYLVVDFFLPARQASGAQIFGGLQHILPEKSGSPVFILCPESMFVNLRI
jgi:hypothetical protein